MIGTQEIQGRQLVLVVDDQEINRDVLGLILEDDYEVMYAENGQEALDIMHEHSLDLAIVLLDIVMPVMDGFEVLERARNDETLKRIPIIVLTAEKDAELQALQMGASDFITKPFDVHEVILARVARIIELSDGRELISAAQHDRLTMLYSRNFFFEYVRRMHKHHPDRHMDAIALNIEQFHSINEVNGRECGDDVLRFVGREIAAYLEESEGIASRIEADRFYVYCLHEADYQALLLRFQQAVNSAIPSVSVHLRMGVSPWSEGTDPMLMFDRAQAACNMVRGDFNNALMVYDEDMRKREALNQRLLNDLQAAVEQRHLMVYYQPKYDIRCDPPRLCSAEALIRWRHPELGMLSPADFVPLLEGNGLISVVDRFVWKETAAQIVKWREMFGFTLPASVNLSRADVFDPNLVSKWVQLMDENNLDYRDIKLEVTETAYTDNAKELLEAVNRLRDYGFEIEMDDFGSGYSSLNALSDMPIDILKMDMAFVRDVEVSATSYRLVKLILDIARFLNLRVVAEGVETQGQMELLKAAGCDYVQGYLFSRPVPPEEFEELIRQELAIERG